MTVTLPLSEELKVRPPKYKVKLMALKMQESSFVQKKRVSDVSLQINLLLTL